MNGGAWKGRRLVSQAWVHESTSLQLTPEQQQQGPYGFFWWLGDAKGSTAFAASGLYGQKILCLPDHGLVVAITSDGEGNGSTDLDRLFGPIVEDVILGPVTG